MSERITVLLDDLLDDPDLEDELRRIQDKCVIANGCFDGLHPGHLRVLATLDTIAYREKLRPIVALNSDTSVKRLKGTSRPIWPEAVRSTLINNLKWPLTVIIFDEDSPQRLMDALRPAIVVKGDEYDPSTVVRWSGSKVETIPMNSYWSTSKIIGDTR